MSVPRVPRPQIDNRWLSRAPRFDVIRGSIVLSVVLFIASWAYLLIDESGAVGDLFSLDSLEDGWRFIKELLGLQNGPATPAFLDPDRWGTVLSLAYDTVAMSVLAMGLGRSECCSR
jgi:hypothetical protein